MKKYSESEKCAKCGHEGASVSYDGVADQVRRVCMTCGYSWKSLPLLTNVQMSDGERRD